MAGLLTNLDNASDDGGLSPLKQALFAASQMFAQASAQGARTGQGVAAGLGAGGQAYQGAIEDKRKAKREKTKDEAERVAIEQAQAEIEQNRRMAENMQRLLAPVDQGGAGLLESLTPEQRAVYGSMPPEKGMAALADMLKPPPLPTGYIRGPDGQMMLDPGYASGRAQLAAAEAKATQPYRANASGGANISIQQVRDKDGNIRFVAVDKLTSHARPVTDQSGSPLTGMDDPEKEKIFQDAMGRPYVIRNGKVEYLSDADQAAVSSYDPASLDNIYGDRNQEPFDVHNAAGLSSFVSDFMNRTAGQVWGDENPRVSGARASMNTLRVLLPMALRNSSRPLKMEAAAMNRMLGQDVLESPGNLKILLDNVRDTLSAQYKDNLNRLNSRSTTKASADKINANQDEIRQVLRIIGPEQSDAPEYSPTVNKYLEQVRSRNKGAK